MAVEYMRLSEYQPALEHIKRSLNEAPPDTSYVHLLHKYQIRCLAELKDFNAALEACDLGITLHPDYPDLAHIKGVLLFQMGALAEAKTALLQALFIGEAPSGYHTESGFGSYLTFYLLGQLCEEIGDQTEACACYTKAAQLHPDPTPIITRLIRALKCAERENEISGWLHAHLPEYTAAKSGLLLDLLQIEGCDKAAKQLMKTTGQSSSNDSLFNPAYHPGRSELLLADRLLASLSSSTPILQRLKECGSHFHCPEFQIRKDVFL